MSSERTKVNKKVSNRLHIAVLSSSSSSRHCQGRVALWTKSCIRLWWRALGRRLQPRSEIFPCPSFVSLRRSTSTLRRSGAGILRTCKEYWRSLVSLPPYVLYRPMEARSRKTRSSLRRSPTRMKTGSSCFSQSSSSTSSNLRSQRSTSILFLLLSKRKRGKSSRTMDLTRVTILNHLLRRCSKIQKSLTWSNFWTERARSMTDSLWWTNYWCHQLLAKH